MKDKRAFKTMGEILRISIQEYDKRFEEWLRETASLAGFKDIKIREFSESIESYDPQGCFDSGMSAEDFRKEFDESWKTEFT